MKFVTSRRPYIAWSCDTLSKSFNVKILDEDSCSVYLLLRYCMNFEMPYEVYQIQKYE
jgi:hypothetical protein